MLLGSVHIKIFNSEDKYPGLYKIRDPTGHCFSLLASSLHIPESGCSNLLNKRVQCWHIRYIHRHVYFCLIPRDQTPWFFNTRGKHSNTELHSQLPPMYFQCFLDWHYMIQCKCCVDSGSVLVYLGNDKRSLYVFNTEATPVCPTTQHLPAGT